MSGVEVQDIAAIGITNQRETTLLWEQDTGQLRSQRHCLAVPPHRSLCGAAGEARALADLIRRKTGLVPDAYFSGTKLAWICWTR